MVAHAMLLFVALMPVALAAQCSSACSTEFVQNCIPNLGGYNTCRSELDFSELRYAASRFTPLRGVARGLQRLGLRALHT